MIIITGATGLLGHKTVEKLVKLVPAKEIGVSVRNLKKADSLVALGVRVREGDFQSTESLKHAFEGATQVLIISSNARTYGGDPLMQHQSAIEAAKAAGAKRILYTSHMAVSDNSAFPPMLDHVATEKILQQSGIAWTALRNGFYAKSGIDLLGNVFETGIIKSPKDGKVSWTAHEDLAEAAATILANEGMYEGATPPLTNLESLDLNDLASLLSQLWDKKITHQIITDEEQRKNMTTNGLPIQAVKTVLGLYIASRNGEFGLVDSTLETLLGRSPIRMKELIEDKFAI